MTDKDKEKVWNELRNEYKEWEKKQRGDLIDRAFEAIKSAPPGSLWDLLRLIEIVQDRAPEQAEAIFQLIKRYFQRRSVLFIPEERDMVEDLWELELSLDYDTKELSPLNYERDVAPLPLLEAIHGYKETFEDKKTGERMEVAIPGVENIKLGNLKYYIRRTMRRRIVNKGAQGRSIENKEASMEYRLKELPDKQTMKWDKEIKKFIALKPQEDVSKDSEIGSSGDDVGSDYDVRPNLSRWVESGQYFLSHNKKHINSERVYQRSTWSTPSYRADPWDPREVIGITEEDKPAWEAICKAIDSLELDDVERAIIYHIEYKIPMSVISKKIGIPEGTLRSYKYRLLPKLKENATKTLSSSVKYMGKSVSSKTGQEPNKNMDRRRPKENEH